MTKTKFYVPAMYFRNLVQSHVIAPDDWLEVVKGLSSECNAVELIVDQQNVDEYVAEIQNIYDATIEAGIDVPIVRISAPDLYLKDYDAALAGVVKIVEAIAPVFGEETMFQLETLSAWQVYETRQGVVLDPEKIPQGYKYDVYANAVLARVFDFCAICEENGVTAVIEPRVGHVISSPDSVLRIAETAVGGLPFKVVYDVTHMEFQGISTVDSWQRLQEYTAIVHVSDTDVTSNHHIPVGDAGRVPWKSLLTYTGKHDAVAYIAVELFGSGVEDPAEVRSEYLTALNAVKNLVVDHKLSKYYDLGE